MSVELVPPGANLVEEVARRLEAAGDPAQAVVVFPGKRPAHFLRRRLARSSGSAFVPPHVVSMDELVNELFEARVAREGRARPMAEPIDAVAVLYDIQVSSEDPLGGSAFMSLDSFFPLGLRIHGDLEELLIEQVAAEEVAGVQPLVDEALPLRARERLRTLSHFYERFYPRIEERGLSTRSSRYVSVAGALRPEDVPGSGPLIFAGFYALTRCERAIFSAASGWPRVQQLFQDGPGLREKIGDLLPAAARAPAAPLPRPRVRFTVSPDTHGQVAALNAALSRVDDDTLVVLPSPETLFAVLRHCLSRFDAESYNVSLSYPLHRTPLYGFFNALMEVVSTMDGPRVYLPAYVSFVLHPYVKNVRLGTSAEAARVLFHALEERLQQTRTLRFMTLEEIEADSHATAAAAALLAGDGGGPTEQELRDHLRDVHHHTVERFLSFSSIQDFARRCIELVTWVHDRGTARDHPYFTPFSQSIVESLESISRSLVADRSFSDQQSYFTLLRTYLRSRHFPFPGTPLHGMQVLGGLETRALQFATVFILDANEGVFPEISPESSLLPFAVRMALGLSTSRDREDLADYNFQLLAAGARTLHFFYVESTDKQRSRFVERLLWEEQRDRRVAEDGHLVRSISYRVSLTNAAPPPIPKTDAVAGWLRTLEHSATSLDAWLECPLKFYYKTVLRLSPREDLSGEIEAREVGTLVHEVLARYFRGRVGRVLSEADLDPEELTRVLDEVFGSTFGPADSGANRLLRDQVNRHLRDFLTAYEGPLVRSHRVRILSVEHDARAPWQEFRLRGRLDRVEERDGVPVLLDYKTSAHRTAYRMRLDRLSLEERETWHRWIPTLQLPVYVLLHSAQSGVPPAAIQAKFLLLGRNLVDAGIELPLFEDPAAAFESWAVLDKVLRVLLEEIVSPVVPFTPAPDLRSACPRCDFTAICGTSWLKRG
ncbi:MAG TPA: PD-(D/E)XK nuclease family protein [Spirochaetia bacterium]|nr:PD-(D/E)XK nuclease family protein [Spirochaetia bacterium]